MAFTNLVAAATTRKDGVASNGIETAVNNQLVGILDKYIVDVQIVAKDKARKQGKELDVQVSYDDVSAGAVVLTNPFQLTTFQGTTLRDASDAAAAWRAANPGFFHATPFIKYINKLGPANKPFIVFQFYCQDPNGIDNWVMANSASSTMSPGGLDKYVQFNDGGAFGGDAGLQFDKATGKLTVAGLIDPTGLEFTPVATNPGGVTDNTLWQDQASKKLFFGDNPITGGGGATFTRTWTYDNNTIAADPGSGLFRLDSTTIASATHLYISETDENGSSVAALLNLMEVGDKFYFENSNDSNESAIAQVTAIVDNGTWRDYTIAVELIGLAVGWTNAANFGISLLVSCSEAAAGVNTEIQFNSNGAFGANSNFTYVVGTGLAIGDSTPSTNSTTGALIVTGGVGVGDKLHIASTTKATVTSGTSGALSVQGGVRIGEGLRSADQALIVDEKGSTNIWDSFATNAISIHHGHDDAAPGDVDVALLGIWTTTGGGGQTGDSIGVYGISCGNGGPEMGTNFHGVRGHVIAGPSNENRLGKRFRGVHGIADMQDGKILSGQGHVVGGDFEAFAGLSSAGYNNRNIYGVRGTSEITTAAPLAWDGAYGGYFEATGIAGVTTAYGIYATAAGAGTNWAGYFAGPVNITGKLTVGGLIDPTGLECSTELINPGAVTPNTLYIDGNNVPILYSGAGGVGATFTGTVTGQVSGATGTVVSDDGAGNLVLDVTSGSFQNGETIEDAQVHTATLDEGGVPRWTIPGRLHIDYPFAGIGDNTAAPFRVEGNNPPDRWLQYTGATLEISGSAATNAALRIYEDDENFRFSIGVDGDLSWGPGTGATIDTVLGRVSANRLKTGSGDDLWVDGNTPSTSSTTGALVVSGGVGIGGSVYLSGSQRVQIGTVDNDIAALGADTDGGYLNLGSDDATRQFFFTTKDGRLFGRTGAGSTGLSIFNLSRTGSGKEAESFAHGWKVAFATDETDEDFHSIIHTTDPGTWDAASDTNGADTYWRTQTGGTHSAANPRGGDLHLIMGAAGSGGTGRQGRMVLDGSFALGSTDYQYFGDPDTNSSWRIGRSGNDLVFQRREAGVYVTKQTITP